MKKTIVTTVVLLMLVGASGWFAKNRVVTKTDVTIVQVQTVVGKTVLEATKNAEYMGSGNMAYVTAINGRKADPAKREFWELLVNDKQTQVGAGSYIIKPGDKIVWKISNY